MRHVPVFLFFVLMSACMPSGRFEHMVSVPGNQWKKNFNPVFNFTISDTASQYKLYLYFQHTDSYPFSNLWLQMKTTEPGGSTQLSKVEVPLANEEGKWFAKGMNEIREHKSDLTTNGRLHFNRRGNYQVEISQIMRIDPLPEVMNVGLILEKVK